MRARVLGAALVAFAALAFPAASGATVFGVADQRAATFSEPLFQQLGVRDSRLVTAWNQIHHPAPLDAWLLAARAAGIEPLVAFEHASGERCPARPCHAPSVAAFRRAFSAFHRRYPWVRKFEAWNEANHASQPTARNPRRAAQYYNAARRVCPSCTIVAADVLDSANMTPWLAKFRRYAKGHPRLWGLHNYGDVNRFRSTGVRRLLRAVRGRIWLTETGGIVSFRTTSGHVSFRYDERRAARSYHYLFRLARRYRRRIARVYLYQWRKTSRTDRFDAGIVAGNGKPRPAYWIVKRALR